MPKRQHVSLLAVTAYQSGGDWYLAAVGYGINDTDDVSVLAVSRVKSGAQGLDPFTIIEPASDYVPLGVTVGILSGDPLPSAVASEENLDTSQGQLEVFAGTSSGTQAGFSSMASPTLICQQGTSTSTIADLNGDGLLDLIATNAGTDTVEIFYAKDGGFRPGVSFPVDYASDMSDAGAQPVGAVVADLDGDGRADIATVNFAGSISDPQGPDGRRIFLAVAMKQTTLRTVPTGSQRSISKDQGANDGGLPDLVVSYLSRRAVERRRRLLQLLSAVAPASSPVSPPLLPRVGLPQLRVAPAVEEVDHQADRHPDE